jgi:septal ring factor EnvC (AmiA/AmiB activator)
MKKSIKILFIGVFISICYMSASGQTREDLEKQRMQIIKEIEKTTKALQTTKSAKEKNMSLLKALEQQLDQRKKLINNLQSEVKLNEESIRENENTLETLLQKHDRLKVQLNQILRSSYLKKLSNSKWSYLLSAENLNKMVVRWRYIHQFDNYSRQKLSEITTISEEIKLKNTEIAKVKTKNLSTIQETSKNMTILQKEQKEKDAIVKKLSKDVENLSSSLKKREKERENLNTAIEKIILAELAKAREKEKGDATISRKKEIDNSGFSKNQGALSYPVSKGRITSRFGTHPHPSIKNVQISNNGVDFTLPSGDNVECVYDGEIVGVTNIPGFKNMVIIRHGSYYTVYSKLDIVNVSKGQKIKRGQKIGEVQSGEDGVAELHFELWKDKTKLDPQSWFYR